MDAVAHGEPSRSRYGRAVSLSFASQTVSSATHFLLALYLLHALSVQQFGLYWIGFAIVQFYIGLGSSLLLTQMTVHAPRKEETERQVYVTTILILTITLAATTFSGVLLVSAILSWLSPMGQGIISLGISVAGACAACLMKEYFTKHAFNLRAEGWAVSIQAVVSVSLLVMVCGHVLFFGRQMTVQVAFGFYALAHLCAVIVGTALISPKTFKEVTTHRICSYVREAWSGGRWAAVTNILFYVKMHSHTIAVSLLIGPIGVAALNAVRLLITPAVMITPAFAQVNMPRLVFLALHSPTLVKKHTVRYALTLFLVALGYSGVLLGSYEYIVPTIFGSRYEGMFGTCVLWTAYALVLAVRTGIEPTIQVLGLFKYQASANALSALFSITAACIFAVSLGAPGSVVGLIIGEGVLVVLLWRRLKHDRDA